MKLIVRALTPDLWTALENLFGESAVCRRCWCMYWRIGSAYRARPGARTAFRAIVQAGPPPGLLAFDGDVAVAWCQLTPRDAVPRLDRSRRLRRVDGRRRARRVPDGRPPRPPATACPFGPR